MSLINNVCRNTLLVVFSCITSSILSQDLMTISQRPHYADAVTQYARKYELNLDSTLFYVVRPNLCKRCESYIPIVSSSVAHYNKKHGAEIKLVLLAISTDKTEAIKFFEQYRNYFSLGIIKVSDENELFKLNNGILSFPLLIRHNSKGIVNNYAFLAGNQEMDWENFFQVFKPMGMSEPLNPEKWNPGLDTLNPEQLYTIPSEDRLFDFQIFGDYFAYTSQANDKLTIYDLTLKKPLVSKNKALEDFTREVNRGLDDEEYEKFRKTGLLPTIYLGLQICNNQLFLIGSATSFSFINREKEQIMSQVVPFYARVKCDSDSFDLEIKSIDMTQPFDEMYSFDHLQLNLVGKDEIYGYMKGIPVIGTELADTGDIPEYNPFHESFYTSAPLFEVYNNGEFITTFGNLDPRFVKYRLGYSYVSPIIRSCANNLYYSDGFGSWIYRIDSTFKCIDSFLIDRHYIGTVDTAILPTGLRNVSHFFQLDSLAGTYLKDFNVTDSNISFLEIISSHGANPSNYLDGLIYSLKGKHEKSSPIQSYFINSKNLENQNLCSFKIIEGKLILVYFDNRKRQFHIYQVTP